MPPPSRKYILIVEDSDEDFAVARRALDTLIPFAPIERAATGAEATSFLAGEHGPLPAVIVLDLGLPDVADHELTALIASLPALDDVPVFVMTGSEKVFSEAFEAWPSNWKLVHKQLTIDAIAREMVQVKLAWDRAMRAG